MDLNFYDTRKKELHEAECESDPYRPVATGNLLYRTLGQRESSHPDVIWCVCVCVCFTDIAVNVIEKAVLSFVPVQLVLLVVNTSSRAISRTE